MMTDTGYKRVLLLGSKKVGKTSLVSAVTSREFDDEYYKTKRVVNFWDVKRRLEFIDTPGLDDKILELMPDQTQFKVEDDPQLQSYFQGQDGQDLSSISGYVIMFSTEDPVTKIMAVQLLRVVTQVFVEGKKPIWIVENEGSIPRVSTVKRKNLKKSIKSTADNWGVQYFKINVKTNDGIENLMEDIAKTLNSHVKLEDLFPLTRQRVKAGAERGACEAGCSVM
ncbi:hypothetical protein AAMO2058_000557900 [Amorphochlora amoebiformis]